MTSQIKIFTGARLHFGIVSHAPAAGREFGGAGLMIDSPGFHLVAQACEQDRIEAEEPYRGRVEKFVARFRENAPQLALSGFRLRITRSIPSHCGLGSGTQLGMAVSQALSLLAGDPERDAVTLARRVGRGTRSAIGIHGFACGGFLVDAGKAPQSGRPPDHSGGEIAPLAARVDFPADWRLLLVTPPNVAGLSGTVEERAFARLPGMPAATTERLRRILDSEMLPAVAGGDFAAAAGSLYQFGRLVGEYFAPVQGGVYANPLMRRLARTLRDRGLRGVGQTSWGPTMFALVENETEATQLAAELVADAMWKSCRFEVAAAMNRGATVIER